MNPNDTCIDRSCHRSCRFYLRKGETVLSPRSAGPDALTIKGPQIRWRGKILLFSQLQVGRECCGAVMTGRSGGCRRTAGGHAAPHEGAFLVVLRLPRPPYRFIAAHSVAGTAIILSCLNLCRLKLTPGLSALRPSGCEDGSLRLWDSRCSRAAVHVGRAHAARIRGVTALGAAHPSSGAAASTGVMPLCCRSRVSTIMKHRRPSHRPGSI